MFHVINAQTRWCRQHLGTWMKPSYSAVISVPHAQLPLRHAIIRSAIGNVMFQQESGIATWVGRKEGGSWAARGEGRCGKVDFGDGTGCRPMPIEDSALMGPPKAIVRAFRPTWHPRDL